MTLLFDPPPRFDLPLSKGGDLIVDFVYKPLVVDGSGNPVLDVAGNRQYAEADYPTGVTVRLEIDPGVSQLATITGAHAAVTVDHTITDTVRAGRLWRQIISYPDGRDQVLCNGKTVREDGIAG